MRKYKWELLLLIATIFYGLAYVFMTIIGEKLPPFAVTGLKTLIAFLTLLPLAIKEKNQNKKDLLIGGFLISLTLVFSYYCQQSSISHTTSAKAGFITSLYIIFVPFLAFIFNKKKPSIMTVVSLIIALFGLYLLCNIGTLDINVYDFIISGAAIGFAFEILIIDVYSKKVSPLCLTTYTLGFTALINIILSLVFEEVVISGVIEVIPELLILGVCCGAFANLGQFTAQKHLNETLASLIMSLESVVSAITGFLLLNQTLTLRELLGCIVMFIAVILCELCQKKD